MHPVIHHYAQAAQPSAHRHLHPARPSLRHRRDHALVVVGSAVVRLGLRLRAAGAAEVHRSGQPPDLSVARPVL